MVWGELQDNAYFPSWSKDGQSIVFVSDERDSDGVDLGPMKIMVAKNVPTGPFLDYVGEEDEDLEISIVNDEDSTMSRPCWSPDGTKIAYYSVEETESDSGISQSEQIYVMNSDGSEKRRLTYNGMDNFNPAWSSDGERIAFIGKEAGEPNPDAEDFLSGMPTYSTNIFVMNSDGTEQRQLTNYEGNDDSMSCDWSPDGQRLVYCWEDSYFDTDVESKLFVMDSDGGNHSQITYFEHFYDENWVEEAMDYLYSERDIEDVYDDPDEGLQKEFEYAYDHSDEDPTWSPDGKYIAYVSHRRYGRPLRDRSGSPYRDPSLKMSHLVILDVESNKKLFYVLDPVGSFQDALYPHRLFKPAWSPDGNMIAVCIRGGKDQRFNLGISAILICQWNMGNEYTTENPTLYFPADVPFDLDDGGRRFIDGGKYDV